MNSTPSQPNNVLKFSDSVKDILKGWASGLRQQKEQQLYKFANVKRSSCIRPFTDGPPQVSMADCMMAVSRHRQDLTIQREDGYSFDIHGYSYVDDLIGCDDVWFLCQLQIYTDRINDTNSPEYDYYDIATNMEKYEIVCGIDHTMLAPRPKLTVVSYKFDARVGDKRPHRSPVDYDGFLPLSLQDKLKVKAAVAQFVDKAAGSEAKEC